MLGLRGSSFGNISHQVKPTDSGTKPTTVSTESEAETMSGTSLRSNGQASSSTAIHNGSHSQSSSTSSIQYSETRSRSPTNGTTTTKGVLSTITDAIFGRKNKLIAEFDGVTESTLNNMSIEKFLEFSTREAIGYMPHRGSLLARALPLAEFFALQIVAYAEHIQDVVPESRNAANQILICLRMLIELGESNAAALHTTFGVFYKLGLSLAFLLSCDSKLSLSNDIRQDVGKAFNDIHVLVFDVASYYHRTVRGISSGAVVVDFYSLFSTNLNRFYKRKSSIVEHMWSYSLGEDRSYQDVRKLSSWLNTRSTVWRAISSDEHVYKPLYNEYTCEWFRDELLEFTRSGDDVLAITAQAGLGKTVLASWICERLQRPIDHKIFTTIFFKFDTDIPSETTSLALAKSLSLQLLELRVGNNKLFELLLDAYHQKDPVAIENRLWDAIDAAFSKSSKRTIIIIDGLDQVKGGDISGIRNRISSLSAKHASLKSIILSRPSQALQANKQWQIFEIKADHVYEDLKHITAGHLRTFDHFASHKDNDQRGIVEHIVKTANGNFLWTLLTINLLRKSKALDEFKKNVHEVTATPTLDSVLNKYVNNSSIVDFNDKDTRTLISLLLVTERPLTLTEIKVLLEIDTKKRTIMDRKPPIKDDIIRMADFLLALDGNVVRFRHDYIRSYLLNIASEGKKLTNPRDAQNDFTLRLLTYIKLTMPEKQDVTLDILPFDDINLQFSKQPLLEYSIRHWVAHLRQTAFWKSNNQLEVNNDLKTLFPSSPYMPLLEWVCWKDQTSPGNLILMHNTSLHVREQVFTEKHQSTLQTLIVCAHVDQEPMSCATYYYRASHISKDILEKYSSVAIQCTRNFLTITDSMTFSERTEIVNYREELITYIINVYQYQRREELVMRYKKTLAELYVSIKEESKATIIWKEIHQKTVDRHGKGSREERESSDQLAIRLRGSTDYEIPHYTRDVFAIIKDTTTVVWNLKRILVFLQMVKSYEEKKEYYEAEYILVTMWNRLIHMHKHREDYVGLDFDLRIQILIITIEYTHFLERRQRIEEARNVLIVVWSEYQSERFESLEFYQYFKTIASLMKSFNMHTLSISVYEKISEYYRATGRYDHEEARSIRAIMEKTIEEVSREMASNKSRSSTDVETIVRRIGSSKIITKESLQLTRTQVDTFIEREEYSEAIVQLTKTLSVAWNLTATFQGSITLPEQYTEEVIEMTLLLGSCHSRMKHYHESLSVYTQLWAAIRASTKFEDVRRTRIVSILTEFYTEHKRWKLLIELQRTLLIEYRRYHGPAHAKTIAILYLLGELCLEHGHGDATDYYREIIVNVGRSDLRVSFRAYKILSRLYYDECRWLELKDVCDVLWEIFVKSTKEYKEHFDTTFVELLYTRYIYVLQYQHKVEHSVLVTVATQYKETCTSLFSSSSAIATRAMISRASILMQREETRSQAIEAFEEVITITRSSQSSISESSLEAVRKSLSRAYVEMAASSSTTTAASYQRAVTVLQERFESQKKTLTISHKETLSTFAQYITMIHKSRMAESASLITKRLRETVNEIVTIEKRSEVLYEAAGTIGSLYVMSLTQKAGLQLVHEIRRQVIMTQSKISRASFVFLVVLELTIRGFIGVTYSELMTSLLTETVLYESYTRGMSASIEVLLSRAAHLRTFWTNNERTDEIIGLDKQVTEIFVKQFSSIIQLKAESTGAFLINLLVHLGSRESTDVPIGRIAIIAGDNRVMELVKAGKYAEAYQVGRCTFYFAKHQNAYHKAENVGYGFTLSGYMAGRGGSGQIPANIRTDMLKLSREILDEVLHAFKDLKVNFLSLHDHELNDLVELLGQQENYSELDSVLESLWKNRHGQKHWSQDTIINLGKRLVQTRQLVPGGSSRAIHLAEDIHYNLRRVLGGLHPFTLEMATLLSQLYTAIGQYGDAMVIHEDILDLIVAGDDGDDRTIDEVSAATARFHIDHLRASYARRGGWVKTPEVYKNLVERLISMRKYRNVAEFKGLTSIEKWSPKEDPGTVGTFIKPTSWSFLAIAGAKTGHDDEQKEQKQSQTQTQKKIEESAFRRIRANWGMSNMFGSQERIGSAR